VRAAPLLGELLEIRPQTDLARALAARGADAARDPIQALVDRLDLLRHHVQVLALRGASTRSR
jgi:hypothetical protein